MNTARLRWVGLYAASIACGCAATTDPFAWRDDRPSPAVQVRQHRFAGARRLFEATHTEAYRAVARHLDSSAFVHVDRGADALYADDFHGLASAAVFLHPGRDEGHTLIEALYLQESSDTMGADQRRRRENLMLDGIAEELAAARVVATAEARQSRDAERERLLGPRVSDIDEIDGLPLRPRTEDMAVIVGAERHALLPDARHCARDAALFREYAVTVLGVPEANIFFLPDAHATSAKVQGALRVVRETIPTHAKAWFYFAGFGGADPREGTPYLVTWDTDPRHWASTALPLEALFDDLSALPARRVIVVLDASFAGTNGRAWNEDASARVVRPRLVLPHERDRVTALFAASPGERADDLDDQRHGVFTYYLLRGLRGEAAYGKHMSLEDASRYAYRMMEAQGRRLGRKQTPMVRGSLDEMLW